MDLEDKRLLEETASLAQENNKLLKKMHRSMVLGRVVKTIYWVIVIGFAVGAFYFIQPYAEQVQEIYSGIRGGVQDIQNTTEGFRELFTGEEEVVTPEE